MKVSTVGLAPALLPETEAGWSKPLALYSLDGVWLRVLGTLSHALTHVSCSSKETY